MLGVERVIHVALAISYLQFKGSRSLLESVYKKTKLGRSASVPIGVLHAAVFLVAGSVYVPYALVGVFFKMSAQ